MTTDVDRYLDEVQARVDAATDGPEGIGAEWWVRGEIGFPWRLEIGYISDDGEEMCFAGRDVPTVATRIMRQHDVARTDLPRLLAALRAVWEECEAEQHEEDDGDRITIGRQAMADDLRAAIEREIGREEG
uniref:Uncharacterized protein n=1 Tax=viral metagenome TaxID=1070528 RepID=A0A6M3M8Q2_9ZZZZ